MGKSVGTDGAHRSALSEVAAYRRGGRRPFWSPSDVTGKHRISKASCTDRGQFSIYMLFQQLELYLLPNFKEITFSFLPNRELSCQASAPSFLLREGGR